MLLAVQLSAVHSIHSTHMMTLNQKTRNIQKTGEARMAVDVPGSAKRSAPGWQLLLRREVCCASKEANSKITLAHIVITGLSGLRRLCTCAYVAVHHLHPGGRKVRGPEG